jgi:hypothetical protein
MCREAVIQEHEQKINRYQAILAARLKAKFFSKNAFDGGTESPNMYCVPFYLICFTADKQVILPDCSSSAIK